MEGLTIYDIADLVEVTIKDLVALNTEVSVSPIGKNELQAIVGEKICIFTFTELVKQRHSISGFINLIREKTNE